MGFACLVSGHGITGEVGRAGIGGGRRGVVVQYPDPVAGRRLSMDRAVPLPGSVDRGPLRDHRAGRLGLSAVTITVNAHVDAAGRDGRGEPRQERGADVRGHVSRGLGVARGDVDRVDPVIGGVDAGGAHAVQGLDERLRPARDVACRHRLPLPAVHVWPCSGCSF